MRPGHGGNPVLAAAMALAALLVLSACGDEAEEADERETLADLSGLAWLGDGGFLAVHDAKNPDEADLPRASLLRLPSSAGGVEARDVTLE